MTIAIKKVAVLGAGVMGSGIAAHLANAGVPCYLLDIVPRELDEKDKKKGLTTESLEFRNRFALSGLNNAVKAKPALLYSKKDAELITPGNFEDNMNWLEEVDWIIEVVVENIDIKRSLFKNVLEHWKEGTIVSSNTSGLSIDDMTSEMPDNFKKHFLVTHFFNPVRYMKLLEIVEGPHTDSEVLDTVIKFGEDVIGKGIVYGKDTPNFVANRIGVYSVMCAIKTMMEDGLKVDEVDKIAGPPMAKPKSAVFRTTDLVGLDTLVHVINNCYDNLPDDDERDIFKVPEFMTKMVEQGMLGGKTKKGFYKMEKSAKGKNIFVFDYADFEYKDKGKYKYESLSEAKHASGLGNKVKALVNFDDKAGNYAWKTTRDVLLYTIKRIPEIADDIVNIDNALKWGFNWNLGPFELWDAIGVKESVERMKNDGKDIPDSIVNMLEKSEGSFYKTVEGKQFYWDFKSEEYKNVPSKPEFITLKGLKDTGNVIHKNAGATLIDMGDGVACLEFKTKMNAIDDDVIAMIDYSVTEVEKNFEGLVVGNQGENFSVGANIMMILMEARSGKWDNIKKAITGLQNGNMRMKYSQKPVVTAPHGMVLGGGCEVAIHGARIRAAGELYMGLVELGVGVIPAGGGTKEMLLRLMGDTPLDNESDVFPAIKKALELIGMAKVSMSCKMARDLRFLSPEDDITINKDRLLYDAKQTVLGMVKAGYTPKRPRDDIRLPGESAYSTLCYALYMWKLGKMITEHDEKIAKHLAKILTGGNTTMNQTVTEQYLLDLECEAFLSLVGEEKTQDRMQYMLMNNKPLRN